MGEALAGDLPSSYYLLHEQDLNIALVITIFLSPPRMYYNQIFFQGSNWNDEYGQECLSNPWFSTPSDYSAETVSHLEFTIEIRLILS